MPTLSPSQLLSDFLAQADTKVPTPKETPIIDGYSYSAGSDNSERDEALMVSELEKDLADGRSYNYLVTKYGADTIDEVTRQVAEGTAQYLQDVGRARTTSQIINDSVAQIANAAQEGVGNLAAWGAGLLNDEWGNQVNAAVQDYMNSSWGRGEPGEIISEATLGSDRAREARLARGEKADQIYQQNLINQGVDEDTAKKARVARGVSRAITDFGNDSRAFGNVVAQGVGSLGTAIVTGGGTAAATNLLVKPLAAIGKSVSRSAILDAFYLAKPTGQLLKGTAQAINAVGNKGSWFIANALMEGSSASEQVRNQILNMSIQDLTENSPEFVKRFEELVNKGIDPEEAANQAKIEIANIAADYAFNRVAPLAGVTTGLTRGLETAGIGRSMASKLLSTAGESVEEGIQGLGQIYQNEAIQKYADQSQDILEDVGRSIGEGIATGAPVAGITQAPSLLVDAVQGTAKVTNKVIDNRNKAKEAEKEAQTVLSKDNLVQQAEQIRENTSQFVEQVNQTLQNEAVPKETKENIQEASKYTNIWDLSEQEQERYKAYKNPTNRWVAAFELADDLLDHPEHLTDKTAQDFLDLIDPIIDYVKSTTDVDTPTSRLVNSSIGSEEEIARLFAERDSAIKQLYNNEDIQKLLTQVVNRLENSQQEL